MIYESLHILKEQLSSHLQSQGITSPVELENIAMLESSGENTDKLINKVVLSLIRIEEEKTLRNLPNHSIKQISGSDQRITEYKNPPVHINMYLQISANCNTYTNSLRCISETIKYFQDRTVFKPSNTNYTPREDFGEFTDFKLNVSLFTPSFEQQNQIWGMLGGKQIPSVIYKIQLVELDRNLIKNSQQAINTINRNQRVVTPKQIDELEKSDDPFKIGSGENDGTE